LFQIEHLLFEREERFRISRYPTPQDHVRPFEQITAWPILHDDSVPTDHMTIVSFSAARVTPV
jgi:hypothetical protein